MLEPGDLIEIERERFSHWAMFAGDNYLIHLTVEDEGKKVKCVGTIRKDKFEDVVGTSKWSKNNTRDKQYKPRPVKEYLKEAEESVGKTVKYCLITLNCEHFVNYLRYGDAESAQVQEVAQTGLELLKFGSYVSTPLANKISKSSK